MQLLILFAILESLVVGVIAAFNSHSSQHQQLQSTSSSSSSSARRRRSSVSLSLENGTLGETQRTRNPHQLHSQHPSEIQLQPLLRRHSQGSSSCTSTTLWKRPPSKWDLILNDDEDNDGSVGKDADEDSVDDDSVIIIIKPSPDISYEPRNVKRAHETFLAIRGAGGKGLTNDIYVRDPKSDVFWYTGKVARVSDVSLQDCVGRQWVMIEKHAVNLRPLELYSKRGQLEIWTAPGDSELEVAYNRPSLQMMQIPKLEKYNELEFRKSIKANQIGFQGEIYQAGEEGFRTWRTNDGLPARPEINTGGETRPPTDEEYAQIQKELQGKDINALYEQQEERNRRPKDE